MDVQWAMWMLDVTCLRTPAWICLVLSIKCVVTNLRQTVIVVSGVLRAILRNYLQEVWMRVVGQNVVPVFKTIIVGRETWLDTFCSDVPSTVILRAIDSILASGLAFIYFTLGIAHLHTQTDRHILIFNCVHSYRKREIQCKSCGW